MNNLQQLQDEFWRTRVEAKAAYKAWQDAVKIGNHTDEPKLHHLYVRAWQLHQEVNMAQFLAECEE